MPWKLIKVFIAATCSEIDYIIGDMELVSDFPILASYVEIYGN